MKIIKRTTIAELKRQKIWLCWNYDEEKGKVPISYKNTATGTNEKYCETWTTFDNVKTAKSKYSFDGIGIIFENGMGGIDIDSRDLEDDIVKDILKLFNDTYIEKSPSGK